MSLRGRDGTRAKSKQLNLPRIRKVMAWPWLTKGILSIIFKDQLCKIVPIFPCYCILIYAKYAKCASKVKFDIILVINIVSKGRCHSQKLIIG